MEQVSSSDSHATTHAQPQRVLILGAGFGGLGAALEFAKIQREHPGVLEVTMIDQHDYQLFTPDLYEIASAAQKISHVNELRDAVCVNVRQVLRQQNIHFVVETVQAIDVEKQEVRTHKTTHQYDYLIASVGSESFYFNIPGMQEHSYSFKTVDDAIAIRKKMHELIEAQEHVTILVAGGGPAGVEVAAEMMVECKNTAKPGAVTISIIEGKDRVLPMFSEKVSRKAEKRLRALDVQLTTNCFIASAESGAVTTSDGKRIEGDIFIWTGGIKASGLLETTGMQLNKRGQVPVESTLQSKEKQNVFVIGDASELLLGENHYSEQTAHEAIHQAPVAARNILRLIQGNALEPYHQKNEGYVVTLGGKNGMVILPNGMVLGGFVGWFVRKYVDFRHFRSVLPFMQACSQWYRGFRLMMKND